MADGVVVQTLEGSRSTILSLWDCIKADERHQDAVQTSASVQRRHHILQPTLGVPLRAGCVRGHTQGGRVFPLYLAPCARGARGAMRGGGNPFAFFLCSLTVQLSFDYLESFILTKK